MNNPNKSLYWLLHKFYLSTRQFKNVAFISLIFYCISPTNAETMVFKSGQQRISLLELYTSEGCSSCPPADNVLNNLRQDPRLWNSIVPVAFHVDYWDYLGWQDLYAKPEYTQRQQQHLQQGNISTIYTPGFIIAGKEWRGFFSDLPLPDITAANAGILKVTLDEQRLNAVYMEKRQHLNFNIVILGFNLNSQIEKGENTGRQLVHNFVALEHYIIATQKNEVTLLLPQNQELRRKDRGIAVWVSRQDSLRAIQAVGGYLLP